MNDVFEISVISPPDREFLTVEIMVGTEQWAELNQESGILSLEFYPRRDKEPWRFKYEDVVDALLEAKRRLEGA